MNNYLRLKKEVKCQHCFYYYIKTYKQTKERACLYKERITLKSNIHQSSFIKYKKVKHKKKR